MGQYASVYRRSIVSTHPNKADVREMVGGEMVGEVGEWLASDCHGYKFGMVKKGHADLGGEQE